MLESPKIKAKRNKVSIHKQVLCKKRGYIDDSLFFNITISYWLFNGIGGWGKGMSDEFISYI